MAVFKCKMCGGTIEFENGATVGVCDSCGTRQTLPRLDDEKRARLYDRANHFRRENEFDKAMGAYEMILADADDDAEAYWGIVLCRYGIEYVEDSKSHKRIPTVNRTQYTSIFDDRDYQSAIQYADGYQKSIYEEEAKAIDIIQKGILEISSKEDPFDVFICYKETDSSGERTQDSVYAQELYTALKKEGYNVFFSRITLENKLGQQYEPYIFAALHSAKVMLVVGCNKDNFNAPWVKNEWSRFMTLAKEDSKKTVIPCYKDVSPYDMPEDFTYLQSQDLNKIGYIQDIIHGIEKLIKKETPKADTSTNNTGASMESLLKRAWLFLEDENWKQADEYCERILDINPEMGEAYLLKLLSELRIQRVEQLPASDKPLDENINYKKAIKFLEQSKGQQLVDANLQIKENILQEAITLRSKGEFDKALSAVRLIPGYKDSDAMEKDCLSHVDSINKAIKTKEELLVKKGQIEKKIASNNAKLAENNEKRAAVKTQGDEANRMKRMAICLYLGLLISFIGYVIAMAKIGDLLDFWPAYVIAKFVLAPIHLLLAYFWGKIYYYKTDYNKSKLSTVRLLSLFLLPIVGYILLTADIVSTERKANDFNERKFGYAFSGEKEELTELSKKYDLELKENREKLKEIEEYLNDITKTY